jgi:ATP-dependent DNA helicase RecQ
MSAQTDLLGPLRRYWGYDSFRPFQERIVRSLLGGHDTCVILPTGGGKSLCYQLPAATLDGQTVLVVSPLIALIRSPRRKPCGFSAKAAPSPRSPEFAAAS